jgi:uncharacterized protein (TIGR00269 family)
MGFLEDFEKGVKKTISDHELIKPKEKVVVACSGGKDSTSVLYLLHKLGYDIEALTIDLHIGDFSKRTVGAVEKACEELGVKLHVVTFREKFGCSVCYLRSILKEKHKLKSCTVCGVIRRTLLNKEARKLKADKIATGHNLDDEAQTVLMNLLQGDIKRSAKMGPVTGQIKEKKFVPRIKPLFFTREEDVRRYSKEMGFPVVYEPCPCSIDTFRTSMRAELDKLEKTIPDVKERLVKNMLGIVPEMRERFKDAWDMQYCEDCGEPTSRGVCKSCELFAKIKD